MKNSISPVLEMSMIAVLEQSGQIHSDSLDDRDIICGVSLDDQCLYSAQFSP